MATLERQRNDRITEWKDAVWREERVLISEPSRLREIAELFPAEGAEPAALDLSALNDHARPLGFLASPKPEGLLLFRLRL